MKDYNEFFNNFTKFLDRIDPKYDAIIYAIIVWVVFLVSYYTTKLVISLIYEFFVVFVKGFQWLVKTDEQASNNEHSQERYTPSKRRRVYSDDDEPSNDECSECSYTSADNSEKETKPKKFLFETKRDVERFYFSQYQKKIHPWVNREVREMARNKQLTEDDFTEGSKIYATDVSRADVFKRTWNSPYLKEMAEFYGLDKTYFDKFPITRTELIEKIIDECAIE